MIPKIIHYCWFGRGELPDRAKQCIATWKALLPDYEIMAWDESNFDPGMAQFTQEAYDAKKYAFVSDYARLYALREYGGIYLDIDVEITRRLDPFLENRVFLGFEEPHGGVASCLIGGEPGHELFRDLLALYDRMPFVLEDRSYNMKPNTLIIEDLLLKRYALTNDGADQMLPGGIRVYPCDYFHPLSLVSGILTATENTHAIHHHTLLWVSRKTKLLKLLRMNVLVPLLGKERYMSAVHYLKKGLDANR